MIQQKMASDEEAEEDAAPCLTPMPHVLRAHCRFIEDERC